MTKANDDQRQPELRVRIRLMREEFLDEVGKLMLSSARVFASSGKMITSEYIERLEARRRPDPWPQT